MYAYIDSETWVMYFQAVFTGLLLPLDNNLLSNLTQSGIWEGRHLSRWLLKTAFDLQDPQYWPAGPGRSEADPPHRCGEPLHSEQGGIPHRTIPDTIRLVRSRGGATSMMQRGDRGALFKICLPSVTGIVGDGKPVVFIFNAASGGLPSREVTLATIAKQQGYETALIGMHQLAFISQAVQGGSICFFFMLLH